MGRKIPTLFTVNLSKRNRDNEKIPVAIEWAEEYPLEWITITKAKYNWVEDDLQLWGYVEGEERLEEINPGNVFAGWLSAVSNAIIRIFSKHNC